MQTIQPCLWFDTQALEAAEYYASIFKNSKITQVTHYGEGMHLPKGTVLTVSFELNGEKFMALNGGPIFKFTEAISLIVNCDTQEEIDYYWSKLTADGGQEVQCGWLKDKYGLSWQVSPRKFDEWMKDPVKGGRMMQAVMQMVKLDLAKLQAAYDAK